ncbi:rab-GTPase-TBC domain-containing protein [Vararia minispora EC-137]|uniref:Rab-GTPase-TBC domain-containing protein n=1 Tax=Vararia minispora EC-137 TaxID=1314806 RepID=A0ACB8QS87_9AGAM|nr:rab-GTPase-TBC domain-containing protein [Vararia minispora EC-137]
MNNLHLSTLSSESMVEIKHEPGPSIQLPRAEEDAKYRLVYAKSKVYVNPTAYARDNIPGFVAIVKREAFTTSYLLAWIPETLLSEKGPDEWDKFVRTEERPIFDEEDEDAVLIDLPTSRPESYAFSVPLTSIYSLLVFPPSLSSWYGSIGINLISGATMPTLYFHDDESRSFTLSHPSTPSSSRASNPPSYPPPPAPNSRPQTSWGGEDLLARLRTYAHLLRSTLDPTLYLVDPSKADIDAHTIHLFSDDAVDTILARSSYANSHSPVPAHRRPRPLSSPLTPNMPPNPYSQHASILHRSLGPPGAGTAGTPARTALLQSFANITRATRHAAQHILSHPLARPIVPHLPDPVKSLVSAAGDLEWGSWVEKGGVGEFEAARVYLARWARIVAEEGERARRREATAVPAGSGEEVSSLGVFELLHATANLPAPKPTRDPRRPVDMQAFEAWFDPSGRPTISKEKMREEIFRRGIAEKGITRMRVWPFLLGVYEWDVTDEERKRGWEEKMRLYHEVEDEWFGKPDVFDRPDVLEERHRIDVDCRRTDRSQPLFAAATAAEQATTRGDPEKQQHRRLASIAPSANEIGAQSPSNEHIDRLASILLTYNFYEKKLGYVQGMSDLCAPIYVVMGSDEPLTFWCFVEVMNRMKQNFFRDQSGMKKQLSTLQQLIEMMDPELFRHLEKAEALNLFFCFRWILIAFKREFPFADVLRLWEVLWTDYYSTGFVLLVALAVLESHREVILRYLVEFDEILKYCNELSMTIELDSTLAQAEVLFLSFRQLVEDMDRRRAEAAGGSERQKLRRRTTGVGSDVEASSSAGAGIGSAVEASIPELSPELRELLENTRLPSDSVTA